MDYFILGIIVGVLFMLFGLAWVMRQINKIHKKIDDLLGRL